MQPELELELEIVQIVYSISNMEVAVWTQSILDTFVSWQR